MKKNMAGLLLSAITAWMPASALAEARIYGVLDQGLVGGFDRHIPAADNDLRHNWYAGNGSGLRQNYTSRLGFEAFEDLGAGNKLEARLEGTLDALHSFYFDRHATLGLQGSYGSLRYGRTRDLINGIASRVDPFVNDGLVQDKILLAQHASIGLYRIPNALTWFSPVADGMQLSVQFGLRQQAADSKALKAVLTLTREHWGLHAGIDMAGRSLQSNGYYPFGPRARNYVAGAFRDVGRVRLATELLYSTRDMNAADTDPSFVRPNASPWGWIGTARMPVTGGEYKLVLVRSEQVFNKYGVWQPIEEVAGGYEHFLSPGTVLYLQVGHERRSRGGHWHAGIFKRF
jgi:predicted porin